MPERAETVVAGMEATLARVREAVADREPVPVVFYDTGFEGTLDTVYGSGEVGDIIGAAGGRNLFEDVPGVTQVSVEAIAERAPEVWVVLTYQGGPSDEEKRQRILQRFPEAPASVHDRFVFLENVETTTGIRVADTVERLAWALHPEAFR